jgi:hypothetical protein
MSKCDADCGNSISYATSPVVRQRRPSDKNDLCAILAFCTPECGHVTFSDPSDPNTLPSVLTEEQWDSWIEEFGPKHGVAFLV